MAFMASGASKIVKTTSDAKKVQKIAELLGVTDASNIKSVRVELTPKGAEGGGSKGSSKGGAKKSAAKKR